MIELTKKKWDNIQRVNRVWNDKIMYESDSDHYGKKEWWCFPDDLKGDCEDFATCWTKSDRQGYHAVLIIPTDRGDFVLSNGIDEVLSYNELSWEWHKREGEDRQWRKILS